MTLRKLIFWPHLIAGTLAAVAIFVMSVTGVLLMFERQLIAWSDSHYQSVATEGQTGRAPLTTVVASFSTAHPDLTPTQVTVASDPARPIAIAADGRTFYADAYSAAILGEASTGVRRTMTALRSWHRWLALEGESRAVGRAVTGWGTVIFVCLALSGLYLWLPRTWTWLQVRAVLLFKPNARGKARDFNWHHVFGIWCLVPLVIVLVSALPISFPWANAAVYQAVGEPVPAGRGGGPGGERGAGSRGERGGQRGAESREARGSRSEGGARGERRDANERTPRESASAPVLDGVDTLLARAQQQESDWKTIAVRLPSSADAPVSFAIDRGDGGQPHLRSTLTLGGSNAEVVSYETFSTLTRGRQIRTTMRFAHTGEVLGIAGQTIAGIASAGAVVLVWTGLALTLRRFRSWLARRRRAEAVAVLSAADPVA